MYFTPRFCLLDHYPNFIILLHRFFGKVAKNPENHDEATLEAIRLNASGLAQISGERIHSELYRILHGNFIEEIIKKMLDLGLGPHIGDLLMYQNTSSKFSHSASHFSDLLKISLF